MHAWICVRCGVQYAEAQAPPARCAICDEEREAVGWDGQRWTTLDELRTGHRNVVREEGPGLVGIGTDPSFAIGQRALLVRAAGGNVLWDCVSLVDDETVAAVDELGGLTAIAASHPHLYGSVVEWSRAFGGVPAYLHAADRAWLMRPDPCVVFWTGESCELDSGVTLHRLGGHFPGSAILHWAEACDGRGAILSSDSVDVGEDRRFVSFMYSFPNQIPLGPSAIRHIQAALEPLEFEQIYGGWWGRVVTSDGKRAVQRSAERYLRAIEALNDGAPLLVVVTGPPASGKSTIAHALSKRLGLPLIAKDEIKESLFDALGVGDVDWSRRLGAATFEIQMVVLGELLRTRVSVIVESNFMRGRAEHELARLPRHRAVQIHVSAPPETLLERYASRVDRHPGHVDHLRLPELEARLVTGAHDPLDLPGELIRLNTSTEVDTEALVEQVRRLTFAD